MSDIERRREGCAAGRELAPELLRRRLDPALLPFDSTLEVAPLVGTIGQPRALSAIEFGLEVGTRGYNLFVAGVPGSGRSSTVRDYLERFAAGKPSPRDWVYVHDFADPDRPRAIALPPGRGSELARDMEALWRRRAERSHACLRARTTRGASGRSSPRRLASASSTPRS